MPRVEAREVWKAKVKLKIERLALALQYREQGAGTKLKRHVVPTDWLDSDSKTILLDVGKKLKGWLKEQILTVKPSMAKRIQYGVVCKSLPNHGPIPIATVKDIAPSKSWRSFKDAELYELDGMPEPETEFIITREGKSVASIYYVLSKPAEVEVEIQSFAMGVNPDAVRDWLETLGPIRGLGDKHSQGFGTFELLSFGEVERRKLTF